MYYNKLGHLKRDCWKQKESEDDATKETNLSKSSLGMVDEVYSNCSTSQYLEEWLLGSSVYHHIFSHRSWFSTYQSIYEGVVFMENNISCKTFGVGSIKIRVLDGIVRIIMELRHVPEFNKNFISLSILDSSGYKYIG